jgi:histidinol-phosphatase (PHP family)
LLRDCQKTTRHQGNQSLLYNNLTNGPRCRFLATILSKSLLYESHCHTPLCNHAQGDPPEYAEAAVAAGLKGIIFTCHCPLPDEHSAWVRMRPDQYETYHAMIAATRDVFADQLDVRAGLESDYFPGVEPWLEQLHAKLPLNHVLGSVHPQLPEYEDAYFDGDAFGFQQTYFEHLAQAAETGLFDTLAHPDLVKNLFPTEWRFDLIEPFIAKALDRIAATGVAMELNTSGRQKMIPEMNPSAPMLGMMLERGIPVVIGADAHVPNRVAEGYLDAMTTLEQVGYTEINFFLDRKRQTVAIADAKASLAA